MSPDGLRARGVRKYGPILVSAISEDVPAERLALDELHHDKSLRFDSAAFAVRHRR